MKIESSHLIFIKLLLLDIRKNKTTTLSVTLLLLLSFRVTRKLHSLVVERARKEEY